MVYVPKKKLKGLLLLLIILVLFLSLVLYGISLFGSTIIGILLFLTHFLSSLTVGVIFRFWKFKNKSNALQNNYYTSKINKKSPPDFNNLGAILQTSIMSSINTVLMIGGFVVLFSVIISILNSSKIFELLEFFVSPLLETIHIPVPFASGFISGIIELTNGVSIISNIPFKSISLNIIICAFLLGFGGISIMLQVLSITSTSDISIKPYIIGKLLQGLFAAIYTYIFMTNFYL